MFDVVVNGNPSYDPDQSGKPFRRRRTMSSRPKAVPIPGKQMGPRVLKVDWKIPARLRRPVREEIGKQRRREKERSSIVHFKRHSLYEDVPDANEVRRGAVRQNRGAERHTGDMYRGVKPGLAIPLPPYAGGYVRKAASGKPIGIAKENRARSYGRREMQAPETRGAKKSISGIERKTSPRHFDVPAPVRKVSRDMLRKNRDMGADQAVRNEDAGSFNWRKFDRQSQEVGNDFEMVASTVEPPKRRWLAPLHMSILPFGWIAGKKQEGNMEDDQVQEDGFVDSVNLLAPKKKLRE